MAGMTIELSEHVIDAIADAVVKRMQEPREEEDCISRADVIKTIEFFTDKPQHFNVANLLDEVENIPSVQSMTDVLDKIKAEIMEFEEDIFHSTKDYSDYAAVRHCAEIIDKYRQEG